MTVSVVIAAYNAEGFLARAVESALAAGPLEVIVVDDASTDGTRGLAQSLAAQDPRVRLAALPQNGGPSKARNAGFAAAKGDWIAVLDADDRFTPGRLGPLIEAAERTGADIVADNLILYDAVAQAELGLAVPASAGEREIDLYDYLGNAQATGAALDWGVLKPLFRMGFLSEHGLRYPDNLRHGEDFAFVVEALLSGARYVFIPTGGYVYTERWGSVSKVHSGLSRTTVDYASIAADAARLMRHPRVQNDPRLLDLLERRHRTLTALNARYRTRQLIGQRDLAGLAKLLATTPGAIGAFAAVLKEKSMSFAVRRDGGEAAARKAAR